MTVSIAKDILLIFRAVLPDCVLHQRGPQPHLTRCCVPFGSMKQRQGQSKVYNLWIHLKNFFFLEK